MLHASSSTAPQVVSCAGVHPRGWVSVLSWGAVTLSLLLVSPSAAAQAVAAAGESPSTSSAFSPVVMILSGLLWLLVAVLTVFMTRRESERIHGEHERRLTTVEKEVRAAHIRCDAVAETARRDSEKVRADLLQQIGALHEKINAVNVGLASVETEVRVGRCTTEAIARRLKVNV